MYQRRFLPIPLVLLIVLSQALYGEPTLTIPAFSPAETVKAGVIALSGPDSLAVGVEGTWRLTGTPAVDLTKPLLDQLAWVLGEGRMYVYAVAPGKAKQPLDVHLELVITTAGATLQPIIRYTPAALGEHRVMIDWNTGQDQLVEALFTVGGPNPNPNPNPDPNPFPVPPAKAFVLVLVESGERTAAEAATIHALNQWLTSKSINYRIEDPDAKGKDDKPAAWLQPYKARAQAESVQLPALFVGALDGDAVTNLTVAPLPATGEKAIEAVNRRLKK